MSKSKPINKKPQRKPPDKLNKLVNTESTNDYYYDSKLRNFQQLDNSVMANSANVLNLSDEYDLISPYQIRNTDVETLRKNYEIVINKMITLKGELYACKLKLCSKKADQTKDSSWEIMVQRELNDVQKSYESKIVQLKQRLKSTIEDQQIASQELADRNKLLENLKSTNEEFTKEKQELILELRHVINENNALQAKVKDLSLSLDRETELREALERSEDTFLARISDMDNVTNEYKEKIKTLQEQCQELEENLNAKTTEIEHISEEKENMEHDLVEYMKSSDSAVKNYDSIIKECDTLLTEVTSLKSSNELLSEELEMLQTKLEEKDISMTEMEKEKVSLQRSLDSALERVRDLTEDYEEKLETQRSEFDETARIIELREKLRKEIKQKNELESKVRDLYNERFEYQNASMYRETFFNEELSKRDSIIQNIQHSLSNCSQLNEKLNSERENLLDEVSLCMKNTTNEKQRLDAEILSLRGELNSAVQNVNILQDDRAHSVKKIAELESKLADNHQLTQSLAELTKSKQFLAYEKGRLESELASTKHNLSDYEHLKSKLKIVEKSHAELNTSYSATQSDLSQCRLHIQSLESQLRQKDETFQRIERELQLSNQSRDQASQEAQKLLTHIESIEETERNKISSLLTEKEEIKAENDKLRRSLESVVFAHSQLQHALELFQNELGEKDALLNMVRKEKDQFLLNEKNYQLEVDILSKKITKFEKMELEQLQPLRQNASSLRKENEKLKELIQQSEVQLQDLRTRFTQNEQELIRRRSELDEQKHVTQLDLQQYRAESKSYEDRLEAMRDQIAREREHYCKQIEKTNGENNQLLDKKQQELNKLNDQLMSLKMKCSDLEDSLKVSDQTVLDLQSLISQYSQISASDNKSDRKNSFENHSSEAPSKDNVITDAGELEKRVRCEVEQAMKHMKNYQEEIDSLYSEKQMFLERTREQENTIKNFMHQIESLQKEMMKMRKSHHTEACSDCIIDGNDISGYEFKSMMIPSGDQPNIVHDLEYKPTKDRQPDNSSNENSEQTSPSSCRQSADFLASKAQEAILSTRKTMSRLTQYIAAYEAKSRHGNKNNHALVEDENWDDNNKVDSSKCESLSKAERDLNKYLDEQLRGLRVLFDEFQIN